MTALIDPVQSANLPPTNRERLINLEARLADGIVGQPEAVRTFSQAVIRGELGLVDPERPRGVFLFLGPTGVGKTQITLNCASHLYGSRRANDHFFRLDMAEFSEHSSLKTLLGDPASADSGLLGRAVDTLNSAGGGFMLFDEIEKAHPDLVKIFLAINDAGRVRMACGTEKRLTHLYLVFTSNLGTADAMHMRAAPFSTIKRTVLAAANRFFAPEQLARFRDKIVFRQLTYDVQLKICELLLAKELARLTKITRISIEPSDPKRLLAFLVKRGFHRDLGARPMRDCIDRHLQEAIATWQLAQPASTLSPSHLNLTITPDGERLRVVGDGAPQA